MYLNLSPNPGIATTAAYLNKTGDNSISFQYTVRAGDNTGDVNLGVSSLYLATTVSIVDDAGNSFTNTAALPNGGDIRNGTNTATASLRVKTSQPAAPRVTRESANTVYYANTRFYIRDLVSTTALVEYTLNGGTSWTTATQTKYTDAGGIYVEVPIEINGSHQVAARQSDDANPRNQSLPSTPNVLITLDKVELLERITSSTPDGTYGIVNGLGQEIKIDLIFRKELTGTLTSASYVTLNNNRSTLNSTTAPVLTTTGGKTTITFTYTVVSGYDTPANTNLNVTALYFASNLADTAGTIVNGYINLNGLAAGNNLGSQKSLKIVTGNPALTYQSFNGTSLQVRSSRDIYRGTGTVIIRQVAANYRIPAVLEVNRWNELFIGRDITGITAADWQTVGTILYAKGTNGADADYVSNTTTRYVLNYDVNPAVATNINNFGETIYTRDQINNFFREAEAVRFDANDREVSISANLRDITFALTGAKALPVKGVTYEVVFPDGFVKDFMEYGNTGTNIQNLPHNGLEIPVIRINKGQDIETFTGDGVNRQAIQPLQSSVRVDCRSPNAALAYRYRYTTDNVGRLVWRADPQYKSLNGNPITNQFNGTVVNNDVVISNRLPNLGSHFIGDSISYNRARNRPQSGNATDQYWNPSTMSFQATNANGAVINGLNLWNPTPSAWTTPAANPFQIGTNNYNDGGMIVYIYAEATQAGQTTTLAYESAYRSVLVFQNTNLNGNTNGGGTNIGNYNENGAYATPALARLWIRGGDTISGEPTAPDFPISRNRSQWRKARLLTPITPANYNNLANATTAVLNNTNIPNDYENNTAGRYMWFWVTWKINVNAYIDLFTATLPDEANDTYQTPRIQKDFYFSYTMANEHFPVIPGRTTVLETREGNDGNGLGWFMYADGWHGNLAQGTPMAVPPRSD
jgi:hypothetical protein